MVNHALEGVVGAIPNYMGHLIQLLRVCLLGRDFTQSCCITLSIKLILMVGGLVEKFYFVSQVAFWVAMNFISAG